MTDRPTGRTLYILHRILIASSMGLGGLLAVYGIAAYVGGGAPSDLVLGLAGGLGALLLAVYLKWFKRKTSGSLG